MESDKQLGGSHREIWQRNMVYKQMQQPRSESSRKIRVQHLGYMWADLLIVLDSLVELPNILLMCSIVCLCIVSIMEVLQAPSDFPAPKKHAQVWKP